MPLESKGLIIIIIALLLYTHEVGFWSPLGVGVSPPAATDRVRVDIVDFIADVVADTGGGQVEDADR